MPGEWNGKMIDSRLAEELTQLVAQASAAILAIPLSALDLRDKDDFSPVTAADETSNRVIAAGLARLIPGVPVVSEETAGSQLTRDPGGLFALVDPLDGTKEFIAGRNEYTVNVAIVQAGVPIAGFMAAPARHVMYRGLVGRGAERIALTHASVSAQPVPIRCRKVPASGPVALVSRSHLDAATSAFLDALRVTDRQVCGSALKFGHLAEGVADIYGRLAPTSEWDIAAGHAILKAAGGDVCRPDGTPLVYRGGVDGIIIPAFVAWGDPALSNAVRNGVGSTAAP
jgi:3'(2'), 5'-bisphosphate nucleotidase